MLPEPFRFHRSLREDHKTISEALHISITLGPKRAFDLSSQCLYSLLFSGSSSDILFNSLLQSALFKCVNISANIFRNNLISRESIIPKYYIIILFLKCLDILPSGHQKIHLLSVLIPPASTVIFIIYLSPLNPKSLDFE